MSQEEAMEQYIRVLSDSIPGWMHDYSAVRLPFVLKYWLKLFYVLIDIRKYMPCSNLCNYFLG